MTLTDWTKESSWRWSRRVVPEASVLGGQHDAGVEVSI
jgi:hypothetical protein